MEVELSEFEVKTVQLLRVRATGEVTDQDFASWLERFRQLHLTARSRGQRLGVLFDFSSSTPLSAQQRRMQVEWNRQNELLLQQSSLAWSFVTGSAVVRGLVTAIFWIRRPPVPHEVSAHLADGLDWLLERCEQSGVRVDHVSRSEAHRRLAPAALKPALAAR